MGVGTQGGGTRAKARGRTAAAPTRRMCVWIDDKSLAASVREEKRRRKDPTLSKTLRDLVRERLAIAEVTKRGGGIELRDGELVIGRVLDVTA